MIVNLFKGLIILIIIRKLIVFMLKKGENKNRLKLILNDMVTEIERELGN